MLSRNEIKKIKSLKLKKHRISSGTFLVEGKKAVQEALRSSFNVRRIFYDDRNKEFDRISLSEPQPASILDRISAMKTSPGVAAVVELPDYENFPQTNNWFFVEDIKDPGNLGTLIRIADWFGFSGIMCSEESVDVFNPKTVQATMGSVFRVPVFYGDLKARMDQFRKNDYRIYAADLNGNSIYQTDFHELSVILLGNESNGLSRDLTEKSDHIITVPGKGRAESLNISVSGAVIAGEIFRRFN